MTHGHGQQHSYDDIVQNGMTKPTTGKQTRRRASRQPPNTRTTHGVSVLLALDRQEKHTNIPHTNSTQRSQRARSELFFRCPDAPRCTSLLKLEGLARRETWLTSLVLMISFAPCN